MAQEITNQDAESYGLTCEYCGNKTGLEFAENSKNETVVRCTNANECNKREVAQMPTEREDG